MVYIILGKGFEPMEAIAPCDILRRGGAEVRFAGIGGTLIEGGHGISVQADCTVEQMKLADTDMVLLPGGTRRRAFDPGKRNGHEFHPPCV